jgi:hypothetical protein
MAKQIVFPFTDTPISGVTTNTTNIALVNYKDWRSERTSTGELLLTNLRSPLGYPERIRYSYQTPNTLYKGSGIEPSVRSQQNRVSALLVTHECVVSIVDTADPTYQVDVPLKTSIVVKMPMLAEFNGAVALQMIQRNLAGLFETGSNTSARLDALMRGSLPPIGLGQ